MNKERNRSDREKIGAARTALAGCPGESARQMYVGLPSTLHPLIHYSAASIVNNVKPLITSLADPDLKLRLPLLC